MYTRTKKVQLTDLLCANFNRESFTRHKTEGDNITSV